MEFKELLDKALGFEQKSEKVYTEIANTTKNPVTKRIFEYLAQQENKHAYEIAKYIEDNSIESLGDTSSETQDFFKRTVTEFKDDLNASEDDTAAYQNAMGLEQEAYDYYEELLDETEDEDMKHFLKFLMDSFDSPLS